MFRSFISKTSLNTRARRTSREIYTLRRSQKDVSVKEAKIYCKVKAIVSLVYFSFNLTLLKPERMTAAVRYLE